MNYPKGIALGLTLFIRGAGLYGGALQTIRQTTLERYGILAGHHKISCYLPLIAQT